MCICDLVTVSLWGSHVRVAAAILQQLREIKNGNPSGEVTLWRCGSTSWMVLKVAVHTTQKVTIPPFQTIDIKGNAGVKGHCMKVHVLMEPALGPQLPAAVVPIATYGELHPVSLRVPICL